MNDQINGHEPTPQAEALEFSVTADANGLVEVRMTRDMDFVIRTYIGLGDFIRRHLNPTPDLPKFFNDMAGIATALERFAEEKKALAAAAAANDPEVQPPPEAA